jgi:type II secretory pathway component PulF
VRSRELAIFFRALSVMINSGLSYLHAFDFLTQDLVGSQLSRSAERISERLRQGYALEDAFREEQECFTELQISLMELGVQTGTLHHVLIGVADQQERRSEMGGQLTVALIYPVAVLVGCLLFVAVVPAMLFSSLFPLLETSGQTPSLLTRVLSQWSTFLNHPTGWLVMTGAVVGGFWALKRWYSRPRSKLIAHRVMSKTPHLHTILECVRTARFAMALGTVVEAGAYLDKGLKLACRGSGCPLLTAQTTRIVGQLREGKDMSQCLAETGLLPNLFIEGVRCGEEAGKMPHMMRFLANTYSLELEYQVARLEAVIKPLSLALMGSIVGLMAVGCLAPLSRALETL